MANRRLDRRLRRRLRLKYTLNGTTMLGFTEDISDGGFFIVTPRIQRPDSHLTVELTIPHGQTVVLEATVQWFRRSQRTMLGGVKTVVWG